MGYLFAMAPCLGCGRVFSFNPNLVPSHRDAHGVRQPICAGCVAIVNPRRIANGLDPIVPLPGAYEAADEGEVRWQGDDD